MEMLTTAATRQIYVDTSGWIAYLDESDPNHAEAVTRISSAAGAIVTTDQALVELSDNAPSKVDARNIASLVWSICDGKMGNLLRPTEKQKMTAWKIYRNFTGSTPSFGDCLNLAIASEYRNSQWLSFNVWLETTMRQNRQI